MNITPQDVKVYQRIHRIKTGKTMKKEVAYRELQKLVKQMELFYRPITLEDLKALSIEIEDDESGTKNSLGTSKRAQPFISEAWVLFLACRRGYY